MPYDDDRFKPGFFTTDSPDEPPAAQPASQSGRKFQFSSSAQSFTSAEDSAETSFLSQAVRNDPRLAVTPGVPTPSSSSLLDEDEDDMPTSFLETAPAAQAKPSALEAPAPEARGVQKKTFQFSASTGRSAENAQSSVLPAPLMPSAPASAVPNAPVSDGPNASGRFFATLDEDEDDVPTSFLKPAASAASSPTPPPTMAHVQPVSLNIPASNDSFDSFDEDEDDVPTSYIPPVKTQQSIPTVPPVPAPNQPDPFNQADPGSDESFTSFDDEEDDIPTSYIPPVQTQQSAPSVPPVPAPNQPEPFDQADPGSDESFGSFDEDEDDIPTSYIPPAAAQQSAPSVPPVPAPNQPEPSNQADPGSDESFGSFDEDEDDIPTSYIPPAAAQQSASVVPPVPTPDQPEPSNQADPGSDESFGSFDDEEDDIPTSYIPPVETERNAPVVPPVPAPDQPEVFDQAAPGSDASFGSFDDDEEDDIPTSYIPPVETEQSAPVVLPVPDQSQFEAFDQRVPASDASFDSFEDNEEDDIPTSYVRPADTEQNAEIAGVSDETPAAFTPAMPSGFSDLEEAEQPEQNQEDKQSASHPSFFMNQQTDGFAFKESEQVESVTSWSGFARQPETEPASETGSVQEDFPKPDSFLNRDMDTGRNPLSASSEAEEFPTDRSDQSSDSSKESSLQNSLPAFGESVFGKSSPSTENFGGWNEKPERLARSAGSDRFGSLDERCDPMQEESLKKEETSLPDHSFSNFSERSESSISFEDDLSSTHPFAKNAPVFSNFSNPFSRTETDSQAFPDFASAFDLGSAQQKETMQDSAASDHTTMPSQPPFSDNPFGGRSHPFSPAGSQNASAGIERDELATSVLSAPNEQPSNASFSNPFASNTASRFDSPSSFIIGNPDADDLATSLIKPSAKPSSNFEFGDPFSGRAFSPAGGNPSSSADDDLPTSVLGTQNNGAQYASFGSPFERSESFSQPRPDLPDDDLPTSVLSSASGRTGSPYSYTPPKESADDSEMPTSLLRSGPRYSDDLPPYGGQSVVNEMPTVPLEQRRDRTSGGSSYAGGSPDDDLPTSILSGRTPNYDSSGRSFTDDSETELYGDPALRGGSSFDGNESPTTILPQTPPPFDNEDISTTVIDPRNSSATAVSPSDDPSKIPQAGSIIWISKIGKITAEKPIFLDSIEHGYTVGISQQAILVGRGRICDWKVAPTEASRTVSRQHAWIVYDNDLGWNVQDVSKSGSTVNNAPISITKRTPLRSGDILQFGQYDHFRIRLQ